MMQAQTTRRRFMASGLAASGVMAMTARGLSARETACVLNAEQEVGPFYVDGMLLRRRIAEDRVGIPLKLRLVVQDSRGCGPVKGAAVDLWHCDAMGLYSGYTAVKMGPPPEGGPDGIRPGNGHIVPPPGGFDGPPPGGPGGPGGGIKPSDELTFLRGIQMTDDEGAVVFETIFPGFYDGRTNHVHFKVRLAGQQTGGHYAAGHTSHVGQVFFPEDWNERLMRQAPYAGHKIHRVTDREDEIYMGQGGAKSVATLVPVDAVRPEKGLIAELRTTVDPTATPAPAAGMGGPGRGPGRRPGQS